ncbi:MAG: transporter substrate-binding domain-containing protein [Deltaproteobacteria bacterium]|jgi:two-component system, cell cycle sensor histidine kinase and response regulator CckA|nr:transporter substrate-binding domain-containing protein [Deltaproteobacteria bacterium]
MSRRKHPFYILIILSVCLLVSPAYPGQPQEPSSNQYQGSARTQHNIIELTEGEKAFLKSHPVIRLGTDEGWEPFVSRGADGILWGVDVDFIRYINESTGSNLQLATGKWKDIVKKAKNREIDGLVTSAPLKAREPFFNFSDVYVSEFMIVIIPFDSSLEIKSIDDLSGKTVAIQKGNEAYADLLKPYPEINIVEANSDIESAKMVVEGKADASITGTSTYKTTHRSFLQSIKIGYVVSEKPLDLVFSIRKDWPQLISIINKSLASIPQETVNAIYLRWFGMNPPPPGIQKKPPIRTVIVDNYYPYTFVNERGEPDGFSVDLIKAAAKVMGLELQINTDLWEKARNGLKTGKIDFLPMMAYSKERDKDFDFSAPHTIAFDAFFTRKGSPEMRSLNDLRDKKIIVMKNDQAHDYLRSLDYITDDQLILIDDLQDSLRMLAEGKGDAALMPKLVGLTSIEKLGLTNLELSPVIVEAYKRPFSVAVKEGNQELIERFNQGLKILKDTHQHKKIYENWFGGYESGEISFTDVLIYLFWIILGFILIGAVLLFWSVSLKRQVSIRTKDLKGEIEERKRAEEALRESEKKYRRLVENALVGVYQVEKGGKFIMANERLAEIFGYDSAESLISSVDSIVNLYARPEERPVVLADIEMKGAVYGKDVEFRKKDGEIVWLKLHTRVIREDAKTIYEGLMEDFTESKRAEEERIKLEKKLARSRKMEAIGLMAGGVAHDLNNILSGIVSYPELLLMDLPEDSPMWKPIKTIQESGMRAADVVEDLLTIARGVATGKEALSLNTLTTEYMESAEYKKLEMTHSFVDFKTELDSDLLNMSGSPTHIKKILMNLVANASEAIEGSGTVAISASNRYLDEPLRGYEDVRIGEYVLLSVSDDGSGITPGDLERIFEPFYTKKVMGRTGTGLGLAVVWNTVQDHNGYININTSEKGTEFQLYFPVTREEVPAEGEEVPLEDYLGHGEKILVVDDEERQREIAGGILTRLGYNAETVSSGEEAIEYVKENPVDLIVLDMVMPKGINGRKTYEEIIKIRPGQKAIIASGYAKTKEVDMARELGAGRYIKKPYTLAKVGVAVKEELEK